LEWWSVGVVEWWSGGVVERWSGGVGTFFSSSLTLALTLFEAAARRVE
jgi:hypothetical protein